MKPVLTICLLLTMALLSCGGNRQRPTNPHHGAFFRSEWQPIYLAGNDTSLTSATISATSASHAKKETETFRATGNAMRDAIVREALQLYRSGKSAEHYGDGDVADVFNKAGYPGCWQTNDDVPKMVKKAVQLKAYRTKEKPEPGDLLLFHNQTDRNRNGKSDDWFTGVAIVVETGRHTHLAVTRTGGQPIKIFISPNGPMVRTYKGTTVNSFVRLPGPHDPLDAQYLSGQLYAGFIDSEVIVSRRDVK